MVDPEVTTQIRLWGELIEMCNNKPVDRKDFRSLSAMYAGIYKKLGWAQQGEVSHMILAESRANA